MISQRFFLNNLALGLKASLIVFLTLFETLYAFADTNQNSFVCIGGFDHWAYLVRWDQLDGNSLWLPKKQSFPKSLQYEVAQGEKFLAEVKNVSNQLDLNTITIREIEIPPYAEYSHQPQSEQISNQWFLSLGYLVHQHDVVEYYVKLLNGTPAKEVLWSEYKTGIPSHFGPQSTRNIKTSNSKAGDDASIHFVESSHIYEKINSSSFTIPHIQWNSKTEPFPFDLSSQSMRGIEHLAKDYDLSTQSLSLQEITIQQILPGAAIMANNLDLGANLHHWLVVFRFTEKVEGNDKTLFNVYMLLDGSILATEKKES